MFKCWTFKLSCCLSWWWGSLCPPAAWTCSTQLNDLFNHHCVCEGRRWQLISQGSAARTQTRSRIPRCFAEAAVPGAFHAWMPLLPAPKGEKIITGNRKRKKSWWARGRPGAEFGPTPPLLAVPCASGGLFIPRCPQTAAPLAAAGY